MRSLSSTTRRGEAAQASITGHVVSRQPGAVADVCQCTRGPGRLAVRTCGDALGVLGSGVGGHWQVSAVVGGRGCREPPKTAPQGSLPGCPPQRVTSPRGGREPHQTILSQPQPHTSRPWRPIHAIPRSLSLYTRRATTLGLGNRCAFGQPTPQSRANDSAR